MISSTSQRMHLWFGLPSRSLMVTPMKYTEEDLDFDCDVFLSETEDINMNWLGDFILVNKKDESRHTTVLNSLNTHTKALRLLNCISESLDVELENAALLSLESSGYAKIEYPPVPEPGHNYTLNSLPFTQSVNDIPNIDTMISRNDKPEEVMRQLKKDIERDTLLINGIRMAGAQLGLTQALLRVGNIVNQLVSECGLTPLPSFMSESLSKIILSRASRTHAGGITFQALQSLIDPSTQMLIPQSSSALPLNVQIHVGSFPELFDESIRASGIFNALRYWGVVCCIECESVFQIQRREVPDMELEGADLLSPSVKSEVSSSSSSSAAPLVRVLYSDYVLLDLKLSPAEMTNTDNIISDCKKLGSVALQYV